MHIHSMSTSLCYPDYGHRPFRGNVQNTPPTSSPKVSQPSPEPTNSTTISSASEVAKETVDEFVDQLENTNPIDDFKAEDSSAEPIYKRALRMVTPENSNVTTALVGFAALGALAALGYALFPVFTDEPRIPETALTNTLFAPLRQSVINSSPFDYKATFDPESSIGKTLAYLANSLNIQTKDATLIDSPLITFSQKNNPSVGYVCSKVSALMTECELSKTLPHVNGDFNHKVSEEITATGPRVKELLYINGEVAQTASYETHGLPDALTQIAAPWNYKSWQNSKDQLTLPLLFKQGKNLVDLTS